MIRFRDSKPTGIYYSQHAGGAAYDWNDMTLSMKSGRVRDSENTQTSWISPNISFSASCVQRIRIARELRYFWVSCNLDRNDLCMALTTFPIQRSHP